MHTPVTEQTKQNSEQNYATRTKSAETRVRKLWSVSVSRPFSKPNSDRRVILLAEATICSHVSGLPSLERKCGKRWIAQVSSGGRVNVLPQSFLHKDKSELKQRRFWVTQVNRKRSSSFLDGSFAQIFGQIVSIIIKTLRNTNLEASRCFKMKKTSLPVDVRRSKTPLLKFPNDFEGVYHCMPM